MVDVQKDFMPDYGGPLPALGDGPSLISGINSLLNSDFFAVKVGIKDMHPPVRDILLMTLFFRMPAMP